VVKILALFLLAPAAFAGSLNGRVTGPAGDPIEGALVYAINPMLGAARSTTDGDGVYDHIGLPDGAYRVWVVPADGDIHVPRHFPASANYCDGTLVTVSGSTTDVDLVLPVGERLNGRVLDLDGLPIAGVRLRAQSAMNSASRDGWSEADGQFHIRGLEPGEDWAVQAAISGHPIQWWGDAYTVDESIRVAPSAEEDMGDWVLLDGIAVSGSILGPHGPVEGATVRVYSSSQLSQEESESDGSYLVAGLPPGEVTAWASADGLAVTYFPDADRPTEFVEAWEEGAWLEGMDLHLPTEATVTVGLSGTAPLTDGDLSGLSIILYNDSHTVGRGAQTDSEGNASFGGLHGGRYEVFVYGGDAGHADDWFRDEGGEIAVIDLEPEHDNGTIEVALKPAHTLQGRVIDEAGAPIGGATIIITPHGDDDTGHSNDGSLFVETTKYTGDFAVVGVPEGQWDVRVQVSPHCPTDPGFVRVHWPNEVDPRMADTLTIGGTAPIPPMQFTLPTDNDHDAMGDRWERRFDLDPTSDDAHEDPDKDGLNNLTEYRLRTHPHQAEGYWEIQKSCGCAASPKESAPIVWFLGLLLVCFSRRDEAPRRTPAPRV
jgi:hypothetical protein